MIQSYISKIQGIEYEIENQEDRWVVHMPKGFGFPKTLEVPAELLSVKLEHKDVENVLHNFLEESCRIQRFHEDLSDKEKVTLDRCVQLIERVRRVPRVDIVTYLSPRIPVMSFPGCSSLTCACNNAPYVALARIELQSFLDTLKSLVFASCQLSPTGILDALSEEHFEAIEEVYAQLVLLMAQNET